MSQQLGIAPVEQPDFYVHEQGDDFTFYLDAKKNVIGVDKGQVTINGVSIEEYLPLTETTGPSAKPERRQFSFSGKIVVKDLTLTAGSLKAIDSAFWEGFKNAPDGSAYKFLLDKLQNVMPVEVDKLTDEAKSKLVPIIDRLLTDEPLVDLDRESWIKSLTFSTTEKTLLASVALRHHDGLRKRLLLERAFPGLQWKTEGRGLICPSHAGRRLSVTFRKLSGETGFSAKHYSVDNQDKRLKNLFSLGEYCYRLYQQVFQITNSTKRAQGLLVVTGSTNSAKSEIARGLIELYLREEPEGRRHHLLTFEDPIEKLFRGDATEGLAFQAVERSEESKLIDYTPRQKGRDVGRLKDALKDALRQTPAVVFVGETRVRKDWELLLDFAATGHFIVTTAHAGSLVEAMHNIFEARSVKTRAQRSEVAHKLLAVVHLKGDNVPFLNARMLAVKLKKPSATSLSRYLCCLLDRANPGLLERCASDSPDQQELSALINEVGNLLEGPLLYEEKLFEHIPLSEETRELLIPNPTGQQLIRLNRLLLGDAYPSKTNVLFPALWRRTPRGVAALTADGLTSLLPHRPKEPGENDAPSCVGRRWFIETLIGDATEDLDELFGRDEKERIRSSGYRKATELDLRGE